MQLVQALSRAPRLVGRAVQALVTPDSALYNFKRFVVVTRSRTGSNLLMSYLNSHPEIVARGEVVQRLEGRDPRVVVSETLSRRPFGVRAKGFKLFYYHPLDAPDGGLWEYLERMRSLHVIHLRRRNLLRVLISREIAGREDIWIQQNGAPSRDGTDKAVTIPVERLEAGFIETRRWEQETERRFADHPFHEVYYLDLVSRPREAFRGVTDFLGLDPVEPATSLRRQNPQSIRELLSNYDEARAAFAGTEWEAFFEEE